MPELPLADGSLGVFGALIVIIIVLVLFGVFIASTFGPIALVIAAIMRSFRNPPGVGGTGLAPSQVNQGGGASFAQAFGASLQQGLGQQLGQTLGQFVAMAAAQHPLELQLAPIVMAIDTARRRGDAASVRPFLSDRFASGFDAADPGLAGISHLQVADQGATTGDHVVVRIDRSTPVATHSEYWTFRRTAAAAPEGTPAKCPQCGAPTAGDYSGACRFCGATISTRAPALPQPTRWLLDDIAGRPPARAA